MESNCKKYNLDHVYCHNNDRAYIRANPDATDILTLLKDNKQLKAMLLLHLDLIQEQSDQLMAKDRLITSLREENESLKVRITKFERRLQLKRSKSPEGGAMPLNLEIKVESPVISCAEPIVPPVDSVAGTTEQANNSTPENQSKYKICDDNFNNDSIIGESNGKFISKIILQRVQLNENPPIKQEHIEEDSYKAKSSKEIVSNQVQAKIEPNIHNDNEDSYVYGSGEKERNLKQKEYFQKPIKKCGILTTKQLYPTREWKNEKIDDETNKEEAEALKSDIPNLEIPKWTIKEFTGLYSIEGTEDLSDDIFLKRHAKLELDEKRRKKWDVQRIREQRTIERLKRRHCKNELQDTDNNEMTSFYPSSDSIKFIQLTEEIPVQAFGDCITRITPTDFCLPWQVSGLSTSFEISESPQQQSSFTFLKKRRRQQSLSVSIGARRIYRRTPIKN